MSHVNHNCRNDHHGVSSYELARSEVQERIKNKKQFPSFSQLLFQRINHRKFGYVIGVGVVGILMYATSIIERELPRDGENTAKFDTTQIKRTSPQWWENEWRKSNTIWKDGEATPNFYANVYKFIKSQTGRDLSSAQLFISSHPLQDHIEKANEEKSEQEESLLLSSSSFFLREWMIRTIRRLLCVNRNKWKNMDKVQEPCKREEKTKRTVGVEEENKKVPTKTVITSPLSPSTSSMLLSNSIPSEPGARPCVLVPLSGDSPIMHIMVNQGYEVFAVDSSETAIRSAVDSIERVLPSDKFNRMHLIWNNFFSPELWNSTLGKQKFDIIYERQGMTSLNREERENYAYLLKKALKDDGIMYVEGIFRTGRVKGNKLNGPPYSLSKRELQHLFREDDGFFVRCEEKTDAMIHLSKESRLLGRVPRNLYVTPFHCVVFKESSANLSNRNSKLGEYQSTKSYLVGKIDAIED